MEQEKETTGNFASFRDVLVEDYRTAKQRWLDYSTETESCTDEKERIVRIRESLKLMDEMEAIEANIHDLECQHIERQLGKVLLPLGVKHRNETLQSARAWKEAELARLDDLRKQGVSYKERMGKINVDRLKRVLAVDKGDITINDIELKPAGHWLEPIKGYDKLKEMGVTEFVGRNFSFMFNVKK